MAENLTVIKNGSIFKRIIALLMDGAVALFLYFGLVYFVFSPIASKCFHYNEIHDKGEKMMADSHLYVKVNEDDKSYTGVYTFDEEYLNEYKEELGVTNNVDYLKEKIHYYYLNYKTGNVVEGCYFADDFEEGKLVYTEDWFNENIGKLQTVTDVLNVVYEATEDFQTYIGPIQRQVRIRETFILGTPFVICYGVFFILVPLLYKNGETFGKKTLNLGFVTKDGYQIQKRQIVARQLFLFVLTVLSTFGIGVGFTSFITLAAATGVYIIAIAISKTSRSFADYFAYTLLINTRDSVWFKDAKEEAEKQDLVDEKMKQYNEYVPENKNLIQIGTEIVDEEAKKEFLESKKNSKKTEK